MKCDNIYDIMRDNIDLFDISNYPDDDRKINSNANKQVLGKMKDELAGDQAISFVGLRPKMYSLITSNNVSKFTAKGVPKPYVKKHLHHELYLWTLTDKTVTRATCHQIRSK